MQINFCNPERAANSPGYWNAPNLENVLRAMDVAPIYAPYGTPGYTFGFPAPSDSIDPPAWMLSRPDLSRYASYFGVSPLARSLSSPNDSTISTSIAPNSGGNTSVLSAALASLSADMPPASNPNQAINSVLPLGPISLVSPLPSITPPKPDQINAVVDNCPFSNWIANHPGVAALGAIGIFLLVAGGKKR